MYTWPWNWHWLLWNHMDEHLPLFGCYFHLEKPHLRIVLLRKIRVGIHSLDLNSNKLFHVWMDTMTGMLTKNQKSQIISICFGFFLLHTQLFYLMTVSGADFSSCCRVHILNSIRKAWFNLYITVILECIRKIISGFYNWWSIENGYFYSNFSICFLFISQLKLEHLNVLMCVPLSCSQQFLQKS